MEGFLEQSVEPWILPFLPYQKLPELPVSVSVCSFPGFPAGSVLTAVVDPCILKYRAAILLQSKPVFDSGCPLYPLDSP